MAFAELVTVRTAKKIAAKDTPRGCEYCPLSKIEGIKPIWGTVEGKKILIIGQSPGQTENNKGMEFVGDSGGFLWGELGEVGIYREDCDVFNVVKCLPADATEGSYSYQLKMRNPAPQEIHCCSVYTEELMQKSKARLILVLGQMAQKAFLETRSVPKQKVFWSDKHQARIYLADHPSYFIRGYGAGARIEGFRSMMRQMAADLKGTAEIGLDEDNFRYLRKQKYYLIETAARAEWAMGLIRRYASKGRRIAVDIEYDIIDGKTYIFAVGFCPKPGMAFTFLFDHPRYKQTLADLKTCRRIAFELLEDPEIMKVLHYGCSDVSELRQIGVEVEGYDWDTNYSEYLYYPDEHNKYGLSNIAERRFQHFSGYKSIIFDDLFAAAPPETPVPSAIRLGSYDAKEKWLNAHDLFHLSNLKKDTLRLYNGGDCDLTKQIEVDNKAKVPHALVRLYMDLGFLLMRMESNGPWFDFWHHAQVSRLWPYLNAQAVKKVQDMIGIPDFNVASPPQVYDAIYNKLGMVYPLRKGKPNTRKQTLLMLSREHPFPQLVIDARKTGKAKSTYIDGPYEVARRFNGRVKTNWYATGTSSGRLSSSGGDEGGMNLQNIIKDWRLQNLYCADMRWRKVFNVVTKIERQYHRDRWEEVIEKWLRKHMPDFKTFLILDYGQIEVRVAAQMAHDENLIHDCAESDIHTRVGVTMTGWAADKIRNDEKTRTLTKNVHFGIMFGIDKHNLYEFIKAMDPTFEGSEEMVFKAYDRYFARYSGIRNFIDNQREFARVNGYVETLFGLHRALNLTEKFSADEEMDDFVDDSGERKTSWHNQCINSPVQGTAHQLLECGMVNIIRKPDQYKVLGVPSMDVHDALYMIVNVLELVEAWEKARYLLEKDSLATVKSDFPDIDWRVPIVVEAEAGVRLGTKVKLKDGFTIGSFMLDWYEKTKKQIVELRGQLRDVPEAV